MTDAAARLPVRQPLVGFGARPMNPVIFILIAVGGVPPAGSIARA
jgi:hypothetical protein